MNKRFGGVLKKILLLSFALLLLGTVAPAIAQTRSVFWERWDVTIDEVDTAANRFRVAEDYVINFSGTFRFGTAVIPIRNLERIAGVEVLEDGRELQESCSERPGTYCVTSDNEELSIVYYFFRSASNERRSFGISYTVHGALRVYPEGDQLWWDAIPSEHYGFSIGSATIKVRLPPGFAPREGVDPVETYGVESDIDVSGSTVNAVARRSLGGNDYFSIRIQYPHDPEAVPPDWQSGFDTQRQYEENVQPLVNIGILLGSLVIGLGVPLFIYTRYVSSGRDPQIGVVPNFLSEPPSDLPPALVGTLVDEKADLRDVLSTILDLGHRGYLVIEESQSEGLFGIGRTSRFVFKRTDKAIVGSELRGFEQRLLTNLFPGSSLERTLESLQSVFYTVIARMQQDLYQELVEAGFYKVNPYQRRAVWYGIAGLLFALAAVGIFLVVTLAETISPVLFCLPASLLGGAFAALIAAPAMPARTRNGAEEAAKWKAFVEYLRNLDRYGDAGQAAQRFDQYLPYAVAAGIDRAWIARFRQTNTYVPVPPWYYPTYLGPYRGGYRAGSPFPRAGTGGSGGLPGELARAGDGGFSFDDVSGGLSTGLESISNGLTNMLESAGRIMTSTPQPSSSSSGRWSSGGRSWSGGGFRGGGGSGGGSRGFG